MENQYQEYYIAFIDVLGFKELIRKKGCEEICSIYDLIKQFRTIYGVFDKDEKPLVPKEKTHVKIMSDSVCIYIPADEPYSLYLLCLMCLDFQNRMFEMDPPILLRGAITKGLLYSKDDIIFGPGFVEAYLMEENNASVPRIIINKAVIDEYRNKGNEFADNIAPRDYDAFHYLNYFMLYGFSNHDKIGKYEELYKYICDVLNTTTDNSIRNKYLYLESKVLPFIEKNNQSKQ